MGLQKPSWHLILRTRTPIKVVGHLKSKVTGAYAFIGNVQIAGVNGLEPKNSGIYGFPDGRLIRKMSLPLLNMASVAGTSGKEYVMLTGLPDSAAAAVGLADLETGKFRLTSKTAALDSWNGYVLAENIDGSVFLSKMEETGLTEKQRLTLPLSCLVHSVMEWIDVESEGCFLLHCWQMN